MIIDTTKEPLQEILDRHNVADPHEFLIVHKEEETRKADERRRRADEALNRSLRFL